MAPNRAHHPCGPARRPPKQCRMHLNWPLHRWGLISAPGPPISSTPLFVLFFLLLPPRQPVLPFVLLLCLPSTAAGQLRDHDQRHRLLLYIPSLSLFWFISFTLSAEFRPVFRPLTTLHSFAYTNYQPLAFDCSASPARQIFHPARLLAIFLPGVRDHTSPASLILPLQRIFPFCDTARYEWVGCPRLGLAKRSPCDCTSLRAEWTLASFWICVAAHCSTQLPSLSSVTDTTTTFWHMNRNCAISANMPPRIIDHSTPSLITPRTRATLDPLDLHFDDHSPSSCLRSTTSELGLPTCPPTTAPTA